METKKTPEVYNLSDLHVVIVTIPKVRNSYNPNSRKKIWSISEPAETHLEICVPTISNGNYPCYKSVSTGEIFVHPAEANTNEPIFYLSPTELDEYIENCNENWGTNFQFPKELTLEKIKSMENTLNTTRNKIKKNETKNSKNTFGSAEENEN